MSGTSSIASMGSSVQALLGPTNTGKTHRAIERMLDHASGMIGLPLRLLAREVYDKVCTRAGSAAVALITGEEKIVPRHPRYWVCTVEAMPLDLEVEFVAVDEIQLAGHAQRGHVFVDRILHVRGTRETWFLGSDTITAALRELAPTVQVVRHPRLSSLRGAATKSLSALEARACLVAFSINEVYQLAERVRQRKGGVAVVMGALSPRTRNAQVAMYEAGEVDHLVATDAIGMGLNLGVHHVAFAGIHKFDGRERRALELGELAQIAGRAGRHLQDGTFGTLYPLPPLNPSVVHALETHRLPAISRIYWRSRDLDFASIDHLIASLRVRSPRRNLIVMDRAEDFLALQALAQRPAIRQRAQGSERLALLWEVCQIPDYRKLTTDQHVALLERIYVQLIDRQGHLDATWVERIVAPIDDVHGTIDMLTARIGFVRTWTYISNRESWLLDTAFWQERTRAIEDRLSDALHQALLARFVATRRRQIDLSELHPLARTTVKAKLLAKPTPVDPDHPFASLADVRSEPSSVTTLSQDRLIDALEGASHHAIELSAQGQLAWRFEEEHAAVVLARLVRGADLLRPEAVWCGDPQWFAHADARARALKRLIAWIRDHINVLFAGLTEIDGASLQAAGRGLVYALQQGLGTLAVRAANRQLGALGRDERRVLSQAGLWFGHAFVDCPALQVTETRALRRLLVEVYSGERLADFVLDRPIARTDLGGKVQESNFAALRKWSVALGFADLHSVLVPVDQLEAELTRIWPTLVQNRWQKWPELRPELVPDDQAFVALLGHLGWSRQGTQIVRESSRSSSSRNRGRRGGKSSGHS